MLTVPPSVKLWYATRPVDFRLGFDGLFRLVQSRLAADPLSGHLFIFRNRPADRVKVLYWGGHGLCLWCQRLECGRYHFPEPTDPDAAVELSAAQFAMILDGVDLARVRRFPRFTPQRPPADGVNRPFVSHPSAWLPIPLPATTRCRPTCRRCTRWCGASAPSWPPPAPSWPR